MAKHRMSRRGPRGAVAVMIVSGVAAACSAIPNEPAPVFMKGGAPGVAATGPGPALVSRPLGTAGAQPGAAMPRETRQITVQRGQSVGSLADATRRTSDSVRMRCLIRSAIVIISSPCRFANFASCGTRAIVPSSFMISQMTPAG